MTRSRGVQGQSCRCVGLVLFGLSLAVAAAAQERSETLLAAKDRFVVGRISEVTIDLPGDIPEVLVLGVEYGGEPRVLCLVKASVRGPAFQLLVQSAGGQIRQLDPGPVRTYRGCVAGKPGSAVSASLLESGLTAEVVTEDGRGWSIRPLKALHPAAGRARHVVFSHGDVESEPAPVVPENAPREIDGAPVAYLGGGASTMEAPAAAEGVSPFGSDVFQCELGIDCAYKYYERCGFDEAYVTAKVEESVNVMNGIFIRDCMVEYRLGRVIIRTDSGTCPYFSIPGGSGMGEWLVACKNEWNTNQSDSQHDLAGAVSPRIGGGVAWVGVVGTVNRYSANGVSGDDTFWKVMRHETGHNWGCLDYHAGSPEGPTIMCGNQISRFCGPAVDTILAHRDSRTCLDNIGPYPSPVDPYGHLDEATVTVGYPVTLDVLGNDHDANGDTVSIDSFDAVSSLGGRVSLSAGTGPGGRDELYYSPPGQLGADAFVYTVSDGTGQSATANVHIALEEFLSTIHEAEDAFLSGPIVATNKSGYTGTGFVDYQNATGDYVEWTIDAGYSGGHEITFRYANGSADDRPLEIRVNGQVVEPGLSFPPTGGWSTWEYTAAVSAALDAGPNTVRATATGMSGANVDHLKLIETEGPPPPNQAPYFYYDPFGRPDAAEGMGYSETIADGAGDPNLYDTLTYSKVAGPGWLNVAADGSLSGTPGPGDAGLNQFVVRATDSGGLTDDATLEITVIVLPPDIINFNDYTILSYAGGQDVSGSAVVETGGATLHLTGNVWKCIEFNYTVTVNTVLEFDFQSDAQGEEHSIGLDEDLSPTDGYRFKLYGTQGDGGTIADFKDYAPVAPAIKHYVIPVGQYYTGAKLYLFFVNDHDVSSPDAQSRFSYVKIYESGNTPPQFTSDPIVEADATEDAAYSGTIADDATDPDPGDTLTFSAISGPAWLTVAADGTLSGTPANGDVGLNSWTVEVADGNGGTDQATLQIAVINTNDAPAFTSDPIVKPDAAADQPYSGSIAGDATDPDAGDTLTFSKAGGPAWLAVAADGTLSGTPAVGDAGLNQFTVRVTDSGGLFDDAALNITVISDTNPPDPATNPDPPDGAQRITAPPGVTLGWTPGAGAVSHNVYFGTNPTPGAGEFQGNQTDTTFYTGSLAKKTWYYWRIDEVNAYGTTIGAVWSFKTK